MAAKPFYPPRRNRLLVRIAQWMLPWALRRYAGIMTVEIEASDLAVLRSLANERALFVANHPTLADPAIIFHVLGRAGVTAFTLSAWDTISQHGRLIEWILPRLGCYSVMRGRPDRASIRMTRDLLVRGERIILFPEGMTYGLNDLLLPFQQGTVQMAFHALDELRDSRPEAALFIAPLAIKYVYLDRMEPEIAASISRLEEKLGIASVESPPYTRLLGIAAAILTALEHEQNLGPMAGATFTDRIDRLRGTMVQRLADAFNISIPAGLSIPAVVQLLANTYDDAVLDAATEDGSEYEQTLHRQTIEAIRPLHATWLRLKNFLAVRDGYIDVLPTQERFLDVLGRLEIEVLGKSHISGRRRAVVKMGAPIDLRIRLVRYHASKRAVVDETTREIENVVLDMLSSMAAFTPPMASLSES